jgi:hypothetical protein
MSRLTDDPSDPGLTHGVDPVGVSVPQAEAYLILSEAERAQGFVRPVRRSYKHVECGVVTTMSLPLAETYAREPGFYGATYCVRCSRHAPVAEFRWEPDGSVVGS